MTLGPNIITPDVQQRIQECFTEICPKGNSSPQMSPEGFCKNSPESQKAHAIFFNLFGLEEPVDNLFVKNSIGVATPLAQKLRDIRELYVNPQSVCENLTSDTLRSEYRKALHQFVKHQQSESAPQWRGMR